MGLPLRPSSHVQQPLRSVLHSRVKLGPQPEKTQSQKTQERHEKGGIQTATVRAPGRRSQGVKNRSRRWLLSPGCKLELHHQTQKPAVKPSSRPSGCLGLSPRACGFYSTSLDRIPSCPPFSWRGLAAPGLLAVFCPGFSGTAGGREGIVAAMPLRWEWKVGCRVGRS